MRKRNYSIILFKINKTCPKSTTLPGEDDLTRNLRKDDSTAHQYTHFIKHYCFRTFADIGMAIIRQPNYQFQIHYPQPQRAIWISHGQTGTILSVCLCSCCQTANGSITHHYRASHFAGCKLTAWRIKEKGNDANAETTLLIFYTYLKNLGFSENTGVWLQKGKAAWQDLILSLGELLVKWEGIYLLGSMSCQCTTESRAKWVKVTY